MRKSGECTVCYGRSSGSGKKRRDLEDAFEWTTFGFSHHSLDENTSCLFLKLLFGELLILSIAIMVISFVVLWDIRRRNLVKTERCKADDGFEIFH